MEIVLENTGPVSTVITPKEIKTNLSSGNNIIKTRDLEKDKIYEGRAGLSEIVFVVEGAAYMDTRSLKNIYITKGMAVMLPIGSTYRIQVFDAMHLLVCGLDEGIRLSDHFPQESLLPITEEKQQTYRPLQMNDKMWQFVSSTLTYINDGLSNENFLRMKIIEMFHIFRAYYPRESFAQFFLPLLSKDAKFANFIYENWASAKTLNDLAQMLDLSLSGFTKKFKKVFGVAPYKWIMDKKADRIFSELKTSDKSLKELSMEYNFCSVQHFCDYCKKKFGTSPGRLRNKARNHVMVELL